MTSTWLDGSCHCGHVVIRVLADIADDGRVEVLDCNCRGAEPGFISGGTAAPQPAAKRT
jgi:hypothetical protein